LLQLRFDCCCRKAGEALAAAYFWNIQQLPDLLPGGLATAAEQVLTWQQQQCACMCAGPAKVVQAQHSAALFCGDKSTRAWWLPMTLLPLVPLPLLVLQALLPLTCHRSRTRLQLWWWSIRAAF
jgi:hypothetical protein